MTKGVLVLLGNGSAAVGSVLANSLGAAHVVIGALDTSPFDEARSSQLCGIQVELSRFAESSNSILVCEGTNNLACAYEMFDVLEQLDLSFLGAIALRTTFANAHSSVDCSEKRAYQNEFPEQQFDVLLELFASAGVLQQVTVTREQADTPKQASKYGVGDLVEIAFDKALTPSHVRRHAAPEIWLPRGLNVQGTLTEAPTPDKHQGFHFHIHNPILCNTSDIPESILLGLLSMLRSPLNVRSSDLKVVAKGKHEVSVQNAYSMAVSLLQQWYWKQNFQEIPPLVSRAMVRKKSLRDEVFLELVSILGVNKEETHDVCRQVFSTSSELFASPPLLPWLLECGRYVVSTYNTAGTRCLMVCLNSGTYFLNCAGTLYRYESVNYAIPQQTVLDGEVLSFPADSSSPKFVAHDVLSDNGMKVWHLPFDVRRDKLGALLENHIESTLVVQAQHFPASASVVLSLLGAGAAKEPSLSHGLLFVPRETSYRFGRDGLRVQWNPPPENVIAFSLCLSAEAIQRVSSIPQLTIVLDQLGKTAPALCDVFDLNGRNVRRLASGAMFKCTLACPIDKPKLVNASQPSSAISQIRSVLTERSSRPKCGGLWLELNYGFARVNGKNLLLHVERVSFDMDSPSTIAIALKSPILSSSALHDALQQIQQKDGGEMLQRTHPPAAVQQSFGNSFWDQEFDVLRAAVEAAVSAGSAERFEIHGFLLYNSLEPVKEPFPSFQGLVLHPPSKTAVTKPRFQFVQPPPTAEEGEPKSQAILTPSSDLPSVSTLRQETRKAATGIESATAKAEKLIKELTTDGLETASSALAELGFSTSDQIERLAGIIVNQAVLDVRDNQSCFARFCMAVVQTDLMASFEKALIAQIWTELEIDTGPASAEASTTKRIRKLATVKFAGELYLQNFLKEKTLHGMIKHLVSRGEQSAVECVCTLMATIGADAIEKIRKEAAKDSDVEHSSPRTQVTLTEMIDGVCGVGFLWQGQPVVCSCNGCSATSSWATKWAQSHIDCTGLREGWMYLFEIVSARTRTASNHLFEGLVLFGVTTLVGKEATVGEILAIAGSIRVPHASHMACWAEELETVCDLTRSAESKGWEVKYSDGTRVPFVHKEWRERLQSMHQIQPQLVWEASKFGKTSDDDALPPHGRRELAGIRSAISRGMRQLELALKRMFKIRELKQLLRISETMSTQKVSETSRRAGGSLCLVVSPFREAFLLADALAHAMHPDQRAIDGADLTGVHARFLALWGGVCFVHMRQPNAAKTIADIASHCSLADSKLSIQVVSAQHDAASLEDKACLSDRFLRVQAAIDSAKSCKHHQISECDPFAGARAATAITLRNAALSFRHQFVAQFLPPAPTKQDADVFQSFATAAVDVLCREEEAPDLWEPGSWRAAMILCVARVAAGDVVGFRSNDKVALIKSKLLRVVLHDAMLTEEGRIRGYRPSPGFEATFCKAWPAGRQAGTIGTCPHLVGRVAFTCIAQRMLQDLETPHWHDPDRRRPGSENCFELILPAGRRVLAARANTLCDNFQGDYGPGKRERERKRTALLSKVGAVCKAWYEVLIETHCPKPRAHLSGFNVGTPSETVHLVCDRRGAGDHDGSSDDDHRWQDEFDHYDSDGDFDPGDVDHERWYD